MYSDHTVDLQTSDYKGRTFRDFYSAQAPHNGPGWYVFGRCREVSAAVIMLCARPVVKPRAYKHYNGKTRRGWLTKRQADQVATRLNAGQR